MKTVAWIMLGIYYLATLPAWAEPNSADQTPKQQKSNNSGNAVQRSISFNGRALNAEEMRIIAQLDAQYGRIPNGRYWYDPMTGAAGVWGGPVVAVLPSGLNLGGKLPATASGGGNGQLTGVFINGREIHPYDVQRLQGVFGQVMPGRYWWDAYGNIGNEGGPMLFNFNAMMRQKGAADPYYRSNVATGESVFSAPGCTSVSGRTSPSNSDSSYSYYVGCD